MLLDVCLAGRADVLVTGAADLLSVDAEQLRAGGLASLRVLTAPDERLELLRRLAGEIRGWNVGQLGRCDAGHRVGGDHVADQVAAPR